ncbi:hypothetical protein H6G97_38975 [Nostoc flagelliforme FACHB-838]|uniref:Uncharacterized protein n=1 Tax=Nostoc flagelliforme FACHB-838 TaxID=2692904 RepID=A0ABR8E1G9_9NOSO|nr:hypothetical protein [Nostoc flagelliforme]MBD2535085.1 hypothetical protein [Nostoc flagelliforme FACHB-838]
MDDYNQVDKNNFLYQPYRYLGEFTPQNLTFNANLQEFCERVSYICNLQTGGKLSALKCYEKIENLWEQLTQSYNALGIGEDITE